MLTALEFVPTVAPGAGSSSSASAAAPVMGKSNAAVSQPEKIAICQLRPTPWPGVMAGSFPKSNKSCGVICLLNQVMRKSTARPGSTESKQIAAHGRKIIFAATAFLSTRPWQRRRNRIGGMVFVHK
jgi:hypothetical protein